MFERSNLFPGREYSFRALATDFQHQYMRNIWEKPSFSIFCPKIEPLPYESEFDIKGSKVLRHLHIKQPVADTISSQCRSPWHTTTEPLCTTWNSTSRRHGTRAAWLASWEDVLWPRVCEPDPCVLQRESFEAALFWLAGFLATSLPGVTMGVKSQMNTATENYAVTAVPSVAVPAASAVVNRRFAQPQPLNRAEVRRARYGR